MGRLYLIATGVAVAVALLIWFLAHKKRRSAKTSTGNVDEQGPEQPPADSTTAFSANHDNLHAEVRKLMAAGEKLEAIKLVRQRTGLGLKEAKDYVERL